MLVAGQEPLDLEKHIKIASSYRLRQYQSASDKQPGTMIHTSSCGFVAQLFHEPLAQLMSSDE